MLNREQAIMHARAIATELVVAQAEAELKSIEKLRKLQANCPHPEEDNVLGECAICGRKKYAE